MPKVEIVELASKMNYGDLEQLRHTVTLRIDGKLRKLECEGRTLFEAIKDCYFFYTGNVATPPPQQKSNERWDFSDTKEDPTKFEHINKVPPWAVG